MKSRILANAKSEVFPFLETGATTVDNKGEPFI
jgi:hypothetical protein